MQLECSVKVWLKSQEDHTLIEHMVEGVQVCVPHIKAQFLPPPPSHPGAAMRSVAACTQEGGKTHIATVPQFSTHGTSSHVSKPSRSPKPVMKCEDDAIYMSQRLRGLERHVPPRENSPDGETRVTSGERSTDRGGSSC